MGLGYLTDELQASSLHGPEHLLFNPQETRLSFEKDSVAYPGICFVYLLQILMAQLMGSG